MECKGTLKGVSKDCYTGKVQITFELDQNISEQLEPIRDRPLRITAKQWREKRSLDANAYYWVLLSRLAEVLTISKSRMHNLLLRRYGHDLVIGGSLVYFRIPDTDEAEETILESETYHMRPTSHVVAGKDGIGYRTYILREGSSYYNTEEMSCLIEGLVSECEFAGIETATPEDLQHMLDLYEQNRRKRDRKMSAKP